jgi:nitrite reductase/ring-hydroxylating ferredoxin subunit
MKNLILLFLLSFFVLACSKDKFNNNNPFLPNYSFSIDINKTLPTYSGLNFSGNGVKAYPTNGPLRGIIIFNTGSGYTAFDGSCPNQDITSCSVLTITGGNAKCSCDNASYSLFTGQCPGKEYPLKQYRVEVNGDLLRVYN